MLWSTIEDNNSDKKDFSSISSTEEYNIYEWTIQDTPEYDENGELIEDSFTGEPRAEDLCCYYHIADKYVPSYQDNTIKCEVYLLDDIMTIYTKVLNNYL
jgi:hypothetical protein